MAEFSPEDLDALLGKETDVFGSLFPGGKRPPPKPGTTLPPPSPSTTPMLGAQRGGPSGVPPIPLMPGDRLTRQASKAGTDAGTAPLTGRSQFSTGLGEPLGDSVSVSGLSRRPVAAAAGPGAGTGAGRSSRHSISSSQGLDLLTGGPRDSDTATPGGAVSEPPRPASVAGSVFSVGTSLSRRPNTAQDGGGNRRTMRRANSGSGPSWLDEGDDAVSESGAPQRPSSSRASDNEQGDHDGEDEMDRASEPQPEEDEDPLSFMHGRDAPRSSSPAPQPSKRGSIAPPQAVARNLAEVERELQRELARLTEESKTQEERLKHAEDDLKAQNAKLESKVAQQMEKFEKEKRDYEERQAEAENSVTSRLEELRTNGSIEAAALRSKTQEQERKRREAAREELKKELRDVSVELAEVNSIRELLVRGVSKQKALELAKIAKEQWRVAVTKQDDVPRTFDIEDENVVKAAVDSLILSREGIAIMVQDTSDTTAKVALATGLITNFLKTARDKITGKIKDLVHEEFREAMLKRERERALENESKRTQRRETVSQHQTEITKRFVEFVTQRRDVRGEEHQEMLEKLSKEHEKFVQESRARLEAQIQKSKQLSEEQRIEVNQRFQVDLELLKRRHDALTKDDLQVNGIQLREVTARYDYSMKTRRNLDTEERESLHQALSLEQSVVASKESIHPDRGLVSTAQQVFEKFRQGSTAVTQLRDTVRQLTRSVLEKIRDQKGSLLTGSNGYSSGVVSEQQAILNELFLQLRHHSDALQTDLVGTQLSLSKTESLGQTLVEEFHKNLLEVRSELSRIERVKLIWEKELQSMLFDSIEPNGLGRNGTTGNGGVSPNRFLGIGGGGGGRVASSSLFSTPSAAAVASTRTRPILASEDHTNELLEGIAHTFKQLTADLAKRKEILQSWSRKEQSLHDELTLQQLRTDKAMTALFNSIVRLPQVMSETNTREENLWKEQARLEAEKRIVLHEQEQFEEESTRLESDTAQLKDETELAYAQHHKVLQQKRTEEIRRDTLDVQRQEVLQKCSQIQKELRMVQREQQRIDGLFGRLAHAESTRFMFYAPQKGATAGSVSSLTPTASSPTPTTTGTSSSNQAGSSGPEHVSPGGLDTSSQSRASVSAYNADVSRR